MKRTLVLGGTGDALRVARLLRPCDTYSIAGLGVTPTGLGCRVRVGGFGGPEGLAAFLGAEEIGLLIDATHPFAARMSASSAEACRVVNVPRWALSRPPWVPQPDDNWRIVDDWTQIQRAINGYRRPFFTLGREPLKYLNEIPAHQYWTVRCLDARPAGAAFAVFGARGPFPVKEERTFFATHDFDVLVTKNSGGSATEAKLQVARERRMPVVMLGRPPLPSADRTFPSATSLIEALESAHLR